MQAAKEVQGRRIIRENLLPSDGAKQERDEEWCGYESQGQLLQQRAAAKTNSDEVRQRVGDDKGEYGRQERVAERAHDLREVRGHNALVRAEVERVVVGTIGTGCGWGFERSDQQRNQRNHEEHRQVEHARKQQR